MGDVGELISELEGKRYFRVRTLILDKTSGMDLRIVNFESGWPMCICILVFFY